MSFFDLHGFVEQWGLIGVAFCVFAETGLFLGFFLPGESLLITAGIFAATGALNVWELMLTVFLASTIGNQVGYWIGIKLGPPFRRRPDGRIFKQKYIQRADRYFEKYGNRTILFARFIPIVRTFGPLVAGIARMPQRAFFVYNVIGGIIWAIPMVGLGYIAGDQLEKRGIDVDRFILPIIIIVVIISLIPAAIELRKEEKEIVEGKVSNDA